jgi:hypothetical protein
MGVHVYCIEGMMHVSVGIVYFDFCSLFLECECMNSCVHAWYGGDEA